MEGVRVCPHWSSNSVTSRSKQKSLIPEPTLKEEARQNKATRSRSFRRWGYCCVCIVELKSSLSSCEQTGQNKDRKNSNRLVCTCWATSDQMYRSVWLVWAYTSFYVYTYLFRTEMFEPAPNSLAWPVLVHTSRTMPIFLLNLAGMPSK